MKSLIAILMIGCAVALMSFTTPPKPTHDEVKASVDRALAHANITPYNFQAMVKAPDCQAGETQVQDINPNTGAGTSSCVIVYVGSWGAYMEVQRTYYRATTSSPWVEI